MAEIKHSERYGPYMTSNSAPAPYAATASQNSWGAFRAFSESLDDDISFTGLAAVTEQWVQIALDKAIRIWAFRIACRTTVSAKDAGQVPKNFTVQGSVDGTTFEDIQAYTDVDWTQFTSWDTTNNKYNWADAKKIEITSVKEYQYYRFSFGECQAVSSQKLGSMTPTASSTVKLTLIDLYQVEGDAGEIIGISVTRAPDKIKYVTGEDLDTTGLEVTASLSDGSTLGVTGYTLSGFNSSSVGEKTVTVTYEGFTATFTVTVVEVLSIEITTPPSKTVYSIGEELDITGMVVTAAYSDGGSGAVTGYTVSGFDSSSVGSKAVTVTYKGLTDSFQVEVQEKTYLATVNGGSGTGYYKPGETVTCQAEVKEGYDFYRWVTDGVPLPAVELVNYAYEQTTGTSKHSRTYTGTTGNSLVLAVLTRGEILTTLAGWELLGILKESADKANGDAEFIQYIYLYQKECRGEESISYEQEEQNLSITCFLELKNASVPRVEEYTRQENVKQSGSYNLVCLKQTNDFFLWIVESIMYTQDYIWYDLPNITSSIPSYTMQIEPRLGIFIDTNIPPQEFKVKTPFSGYFASMFGLSVPTEAEGKITISFTMPERDVSLTSNYVASLSHIIVDPPAKTGYVIGEGLDISGMVVKAVYADGTEKAVTGFELSGFDSSTDGKKVVTVTYQNMTATFEVTVFGIQSITVTTLPHKVRYRKGEALDSAGMVVTANFFDDTTAIVSEYELSELDSTSIGPKEIIVSYLGITTTFTAIVYQLESISITERPAKTRYPVGAFLNTDGMVVTAVYSDGVRETVTGYTLSDFDSSAAGEKIITVAYEGLTTAFEVMVYELFSIAVTTLPEKKEYQIGESLDTTGMIVTATYSDGVTEAVTGYSLSWFDNTDTGRVYLTVTFQEKETEFYVTVVDPEEEVLFERILKSPDCYVTLLIHWKNGEFADMTNNEIKEESLVLEESICEDDTLRYGGCIANRFEIDVSASQFNDLEPSGSIHVTVKASGTVDGKKRTSSPYHLFDGTIESAKRQRNLNVRKIIAYDDLYYKGNMDIISWYNRMKFPITIGEFRRQMMEYVGIPMVETVLSNDAKYFPSNIKQDHLYVKDVLRDIAETEARFGIMDRQGRFVFRRLEPNGGPLKGDPIKIDLYKSIDFKEGKIYKIQALQPMDYIGFASVPTSAEASLEYYWIENNVVFTMPETQKDYNAGRTPWPRQGQWRDYSVQQYETQQPGNPRLTVGKNVEYIVRKTLLDGTKKTWTINSYVFYRKLRGIQSMTDTVGARNGPFTKPEGEDDKILSYLKNNSMRAVSIAEGTDFNPETDAVPGTMYFLQGLVSTDNGMQSSRILLDHQYHTRVFMGAGSILTRSAGAVEANAIKIGAKTVWKKIGNLQWERHDLGLYFQDPIYTDEHAFFFTKSKMYRLEGFEFRVMFNRREAGGTATAYPDHLIHVSTERERENLYDNGPVEIVRDNMIIHRLYDDQSTVFTASRNYEAYDVIRPDDYRETKYASFLLEAVGYNETDFCIRYSVGVARGNFWSWLIRGIWFTDMTLSKKELAPDSTKVSSAEHEMVFTVGEEQYAFGLSSSYPGYAYTKYLSHKASEYSWETIFLDDASNPLGNSNNYNSVYMKRYNNEIFASSKRGGDKVYQFDKTSLSWKVAFDVTNFDGIVANINVKQLSYSRKKNVFYYLYVTGAESGRLYRCVGDGSFQFKEVVGYRNIKGLTYSYNNGWLEFEDGYGFIAVGYDYYYTLPYAG